MQEAAVDGPGEPTMAQLRAAKRTANERFVGRSGVSGVGIGDRCVRLYVRDVTVTASLPADIDGVRIECVEVGDIEAQD